jgi:WD40 repeat protein
MKKEAHRLFLIRAGILLLALGCSPRIISPAPAPTPIPNSTPVSTEISPTPTLLSAQSITLSGHSGAVTRLSWSPDGRLLASASGDFQSTDYTVRVWHPDGTLAYTLTGHTGVVTALAWSPDGKTLASASLDKSIRLWSSDGTPDRVLQGDAGHVFAVAWSPDGDILASGAIVGVLDPTVQLWDRDGQIVKTLSTSFSGGKFYNLAWSPDGNYLVGGATDYKLWRADGELVFWRESHASSTPSWGLAWSPDSQLWAVGDESGYIQIYTNSGEEVALLSDQTGINSLAWSPDGKILAGPKSFWNSDGTRLYGLRLQPEYVMSLAWSPDGRLLASGGSDTLVQLRTPDGQHAAFLEGHTGMVNAVAWSPAGNILASAGEDGTIRLWKFGNAK